jgi:glycosyltransferase involved in cell wall biosynthesis
MVVMRILIIAGIFPPDIGGPANYLPKVSSALAARGHQISVICFSEKSQYAGDSNYPFRVDRILRRQNIILRELKTIYRGLTLARSHDIIYSNGNDFKSWLIGFFTGIPRVHKIVGDTAWERAQNRKWYSGNLDQYQVEKHSLFMNLMNWIRSFPLRQSSGIITPSAYLKKIVSQWKIPDSQVSVIYNSFDHLPATSQSDMPKLLDTKKVMCTICRLVPWKGVDTLIKVLADIPDLGFIIVGDGPLEADLKKLAISLKLEKRIHFAGAQPRAKVSGFLRQSDFFILNSSYEGLPHVVLEAMSCQRLVLASRVGGTPEVVDNKKTGILFDYNNIESIKQAVLTAMNENHDQEIAAASRMINHHFEFEKMLVETEQVLQSLAKSR